VTAVIRRALLLMAGAYRSGFTRGDDGRTVFALAGPRHDRTRRRHDPRFQLASTWLRRPSRRTSPAGFSSSRWPGGADAGALTRLSGLDPESLHDPRSARAVRALCRADAGGSDADGRPPPWRCTSAEAVGNSKLSVVGLLGEASGPCWTPSSRCGATVAL
jgi:hypothetical protein